MAVHVTDEAWSAYQQQCRENRDAWMQDRAGRSVVGNPFLVVEDGIGAGTSAGRAVSGTRRGRKAKAREGQEMGEGQQTSGSAGLIADRLRAQQGQGWVQEPRGRKRRARSADKLVDRMMGEPDGGESGEPDSDSAA
jgi:hypothetical protein